MINNRVIVGFGVVVLIAFLSDTVTTMIGLQSPNVAELNPLYLLTGSVSFFILKASINLLLYGFTIYFYRKTGFKFIWAGCLLLSAFQIFCAINNVSVILATR